MRTPPPSVVAPYPTAVVAVVGASTLLTTLSISGVSLALPELGREMGVSIGASAWVMLAFLLTASCFMLIAGRLGDIAGLRRIYLIGFAVVGIATLLCGLAPTFPILAIARGLQGFGGAMVMATGPALLTTSAPPERRGEVLGTVATATYIGLTIGPSLGGLIVTWLGWRWVFLLNVPVAAVIVLMGSRWLPRSKGNKKASMDWKGAGALWVWMPLLILPLAIGGKAGWKPWMPVSLVLGLAFLAIFVRVERKAKGPLLDLGLFRSRIFTGAVLSAVANYIALFTVIILLPFYLEEGRGFSPSRAGLFLSVQPLLMALVASPAGRLSDRFGTRGLCVGGMTIMAIGVYVLSCCGQDAPTWHTVLGLALAGLGTGLFISPNSSALMGAAPRDRQGVAAAVLAISRNIGMLVGTGLATAVYLLAGGVTGHTWTGEDFNALSTALVVAASVALLGAVVAGLRGESV